MRSKNKIIIIVIVIIMLLTLAGGAFAYIYFGTGLFNNPKENFYTYLLQNEKVISTLAEEEFRAYNTKTRQVPYTNNSQLSFNYSQSGSNELNFINDITVVTQGKTNYAENKEYKNFDIQYKAESLFDFKYLKTNDKYGLLSNEVTNKYVAVENKNLKELFTKMGYTQEELQEIPDSFEIPDYSQFLNLTDNEKNTIMNKYMNIILENVPDEQYKKNDKSTINVFNVDHSVNSYEMQLTQKQLYQLGKTLLETLKVDMQMLNIIKSNMDLNGITSIEIEDIQNRIQVYIDDIISKQSLLTDNIAFRIVVYESKGQTIRTEIIIQNDKTTIDLLQTDTSITANINYSAFGVNNYDPIVTISSKKEKVNNEIKVTVEVKALDDELGTVQMAFSGNIIGGIEENNIEEKYEVTLIFGGVNFSVKYNNKMAYDTNLQVEEINKDNAGILNEYSSNTLIVLINGITERLQEILQEKLEVIGISTQSILSDPLMQNILKSIEVNINVSEQDKNQISNIENQVSGLTELEETARQMFNNKFEVYKGSQKGTNVKALITAIKVSNADTSKSIKIGIKLNENDMLPEILTEEVLNNLVTQIEATKDYQVDFEYEESTKYIKKAVISIDTEQIPQI